MAPSHARSSSVSLLSTVSLGTPGLSISLASSATDLVCPSTLLCPLPRSSSVSTLSTMPSTSGAFCFSTFAHKLANQHLKATYAPQLRIPRSSSVSTLSSMPSALGTPGLSSSLASSSALLLRSGTMAPGPGGGGGGGHEESNIKRVHIGGSGEGRRDAGLRDRGARRRR